MKNKFWLWLCLGTIANHGMALDIKTYQNSWDLMVKNPQQLKQFINGMPIGADLHCHASGAVSTEKLVNIAKENHYCIDSNYRISYPINGVCENAKFTDEFLNSPYAQKKTIEAWSMQNFHAYGREDGKTHFFKTFEKFNILPKENWPAVIADVVDQAHDQHIQYLELMLSMHGKKPNVVLSADNHHIEDVLNHPAYKKYIQNNVLYFSHLKNKVKLNTPWLGEDVDLAWILEIKRNQPFEQFWKDAVMVFAIANKVPDIVAINMVQAEYASYAQNDYTKQMKLLEILKLYYPKVKVVIHAGEVPAEFAKQSDVDHIQTALNFVKPTRIGHGTMISYEKEYTKTLDEMAKDNIPVEINLTSNDQILGVSAKNHPVQTYLKAHVPIVISSDDPGVSRNNLSHEYYRAVVEQKLSLDEIIKANRNSLTYSLLPGHSLWKDSEKAIPVNNCQFMKSYQCINYISKNPKAYQQWVLENNLETYFLQNLKNS
jgi:adenosine deaminase